MRFSSPRAFFGVWPKPGFGKGSEPPPSRGGRLIRGFWVQFPIRLNIEGSYWLKGMRVLSIILIMKMKVEHVPLRVS